MVSTAGEELRSDGSDELALQRLWVGALCVLDRDVPLFDPSQQPQQVTVTQQVRCLELPVRTNKEKHVVKTGRRRRLRLLHQLFVILVTHSDFRETKLSKVP